VYNLVSRCEVRTENKVTGTLEVSGPKKDDVRGHFKVTYVTTDFVIYGSSSGTATSERFR
jgi:hypothetical protein